VPRGDALPQTCDSRGSGTLRLLLPPMLAASQVASFSNGSEWNGPTGNCLFLPRAVKRDRNLGFTMIRRQWVPVVLGLDIGLDTVGIGN